MNLRSPIVAMLWENWRLTRAEAAQRLALGIVASSAALLFGASATVAFTILLVIHAVFWLSIAKLNGGRFMDGYKPGFPFYLLYTRPVPTPVLVGVAMAYDALSCVALYVASAAVLGFVFGQPLPLFSMTVWIVSVHLASLCIQWATRSRVAQWLGSSAVWLPFVFLIQHRMTSSLQVEFSLAENAVMALIGVVSFGLTVVGVARQRRGDDVASVSRAKGSGGYPDWLVNLFPFTCPTSSATKAQVWFELRSSGVPVLTIGLALAMLIFLLFAISIPLAPVRHAAITVTMFSVPAVVFVLGRNAFGIRRKQGRAYAGAFEATQPYDTAQLAGIKVLVRTACLLTALIAIVVSAWTSSSLVSAWGEWMVSGQKDAVPGLLQLHRKIGDAFGGLTGYAYVAQAVVASIAVAAIVSWLAALEALRASYRRRLLIGSSLLLFWGLAIILLTLAGRNGIAPLFLVDAILRATRWIAMMATVLTTIYLFWSGFVERTLTARYMRGVIIISAAFAAAWVTVLRTTSVQLPGVTDSATILWSVLLPLMACVLAPWSLSRIRHVTSR